MDRGEHGAEHILRHVGGVGILQALLASVAVDQRRIQVEKFPPGWRA
jgi:hypothetical protein